METVELDGADLKEWDAFVAQSPHGTVFHCSDWLRICSDSFGRDFKVYVCRENDQIVGGCSFFVKKSLLYRTASSTIHMTPYGGFVLEPKNHKVRDNEHLQSKIIRSLCNMIEHNGYHAIRCANSPDFIDVRPFTWNGWDSDVLYTYFLGLDTDLEKKISKEARWTIRKAMKHNIAVKKLHDPEIFYGLYDNTYRRQNLKVPADLSFITQMLRMVEEKGRGEMWVAQNASGENIAAEILTYDNRRAYRWAAASNEAHRSFGATTHLLFEIFKDLKAREIREINLMAGNMENLSNFVTQFNPNLVPYYAVKKTIYKKFLKNYFAYAISSILGFFYLTNLY